MYVNGRLFTTPLFRSFTTLIFLSVYATCSFAAVVLHTMVGSSSFTFSNSPSIMMYLTVEIKLKFVTVEHTPVRTAKSLVKHIKRMLQVYDRVGFTVRYIMMDGEFEKVKELLTTIVCDTTAAKEHVTEAERKIRVVK